MLVQLSARLIGASVYSSVYQIDHCCSIARETVISNHLLCIHSRPTKAMLGLTVHGVSGQKVSLRSVD